MNNAHNYLYFILILLLCSCFENSKKHDKNDISNSIKEIGDKNNIKLDKDSIYGIVNNFYTWYIKDEILKPSMRFNASIKKYPNGYWGLDIDGLKNELDSFKFFSSNFIDEIINRNVECNRRILGDQIMDPDDIYMNLGDSTSKYCDFLFYNNWIGGQDYTEVKDFRIVKHVIKDSSLNSIVFVESLNDHNYVFSYITVRVIKQLETYKIDNIITSFTPQ